MDLGFNVRECVVAWACGVYLGPGVRAGQGPGGGELVDPRRRVDSELGEDVALGLGELGALPEDPGGAGEGAEVDAVELAAELQPGGVQAFSVMQASSRASQHKTTSARMRCSLRW